MKSYGDWHNWLTIGVSKGGKWLHGRNGRALEKLNQYIHSWGNGTRLNSINVEKHKCPVSKFLLKNTWPLDHSLILLMLLDSFTRNWYRIFIPLGPSLAIDAISTGILLKYLTDLAVGDSNFPWLHTYGFKRNYKVVSGCAAPFHELICLVLQVPVVLFCTSTQFA